MRLILGMLLGAALTVALAYVHDARVPAQAGIGPTTGEAFQARTLVNWPVAGRRWNEFTGGVASLGRDAKRGFDRLAASF